MLNSLTPAQCFGYSGGAVSLEAVRFESLNEIAGCMPLISGFFTSVCLKRTHAPVYTQVAPSVAGRGGEAFGLAGLLFLQSLNPAFVPPPSFESEGRGLNPEIGASPMPKTARIFLTYSLVAITTLAIERNTPIAVIALSLAALVLVHVIGGANHVK